MPPRPLFPRPTPPGRQHPRTSPKLFIGRPSRWRKFRRKVERAIRG